MRHCSSAERIACMSISHRLGADRTENRGTNQTGMRAHNERLVLTLLRRHDSLARVDLARLTGLSAQTVSVIMRGLEADGLICKGQPRRGRVGQPSVPMHLAADGALFLGLKVGRRSQELVLVDFVGQVLGQVRELHDIPTPDRTVAFVRRAVADLTADLSGARRDRIAGLGIGLPFHLWDWADALGVPPAAMAVWSAVDLRAEIAAVVPYPVHIGNDASAACNAEIVFGRRTASDGLRDFVYAFLGYFAGGGLVLGGRLFAGRTGNAGALGSLPVPGAAGSRSLLQVASLSGLEAALIAQGHDGSAVWEAPETWRVDRDILAAWIREAAAGLAYAAASGAAFLEIEALVLDGWLPAEVRAALVAETEAALGRIDLSGTSRPAILPGTIGPGARSLGAASLPLSVRFLADPGAPGIPAGRPAGA